MLILINLVILAARHHGQSAAASSLSDAVGVLLIGAMCFEQALRVLGLQQQLFAKPAALWEVILVALAAVESFALLKPSIIAVLRAPRIVIRITQKFSKIP